MFRLNVATCTMRADLPVAKRKGINAFTRHWYDIG